MPMKKFHDALGLKGTQENSISNYLSLYQI